MLHINPEELPEVHRNQLDLLVTHANNSPAYLAKMLDEHPSTVQGWIRRGRISKKGAIKVEQNKYLSLHFTAKQLRPDMPSQ